MNRRIVFGVLLGLVLIAGAVMVGFYAYQAGVAHGLVESGKVFAEGSAPPEGRVYHYWGGPFFHHGPFGFGFGFLGCLIPLLFFFLLTRLLFWPRRWFWHYGGPGMHWGHGPGEKGVPPMFEEWHRRAHGSPPGSGNEPPPGPQ
jgi:hypothetical protein